MLDVFAADGVHDDAGIENVALTVLDIAELVAGHVTTQRNHLFAGSPVYT